MEQQFTIDPKLLDELSKSIKTEKDLAALSKHLLKLTVERAMDAELDEHLGYPKHTSILSEARIQEIAVMAIPLRA